MLRAVGSLVTTLILLGALFALVLGGTLAQSVWGAEVVQTSLFSKVFFEASGWWIPGLPLVFSLLAVNLLFGAWRNLPRDFSSVGLWGVHLGVVLFCVASLGFSVVQTELILGIVPGSFADRAFPRDSAGGTPVELPFQLGVDQFRIETYAGSAEPSDYVSVVRYGSPGKWHVGEIRMNSPLRVEGWTIYQSSVQKVSDVQSPVFKLVHNAWGWVPYGLSGLIALSLLIHLVWGRLRRVPRAP